jgi:hypothetical protein
MTHLRTIMIEELVRRNYSESTHECYIRTIEEFAASLTAWSSCLSTPACPGVGQTESPVAPIAGFADKTAINTAVNIKEQSAQCLNCFITAGLL